VTPRQTARAIPSTDRYFAVELPEPLGAFHFRFPSYGKAARMVGLLQELQEGEGVDRLVSVLDVAGYAVGACWWHESMDLEAGPAPATGGGEDWRVYGDTVIDELQEHGVNLPGIMELINTLIGELGARMVEANEATVEAGN